MTDREPKLTREMRDVITEVVDEELSPLVFRGWIRNLLSDLDAAEKRIEMLERGMRGLRAIADSCLAKKDPPECPDCAKDRADGYTHCGDCAPEPDTGGASFGERCELARREKYGR